MMRLLLLVLCFLSVESFGYLPASPLVSGRLSARAVVPRSMALPPWTRRWAQSTKLRAGLASDSGSTNSQVQPTSTEKLPKLPVTVLSGFLGSGKTTLLQHILTNNAQLNDHKKYAIIVNDMSELNIDSMLVKPFIQRQEEQLIEMSNGCICCTLREDLLREITKIAKQGTYDHLIIESTGISEPMAVAETFTFDVNDIQTDSDEDEASEHAEHSEHGDHCDHDHDHEACEEESKRKSMKEPAEFESLMNYAEIDSMVTVVDAVNFLHHMKNVEDLKSMNLHADEEDTRTITDLVVSQIEFASVIILNKCDLLPKEDARAEVKAWIRSLNADAKIIEAVRSNVSVSEIIGSRSYDYDKVSQSAAWLKAINQSPGHHHDKTPETEEYGISSFVYRARRPFHPARLMLFIERALPSEGSSSEADALDKDTSSSSSSPSIVGTSKIIRSKGFFWLAVPSERMNIWSQAGALFQVTSGGNWWMDTPQELWPEDADEIANIKAEYDGEFGDRRQELVFIGTSMEKVKIIDSLNECLLTDEELTAGPSAWALYENPFPEEACELAPSSE